MINENLLNSLLDQWVEEKENSHTYLYIGAWLKNKGFDNIGKFFIDASKEEDGHAQSILDLLTDLNLMFEPRPIQNMSFPIMSIADVAQKFVDRETQTTESLQNIKEISMTDDSMSPIIEEHIREMIHKQQHEMSECLEFMDKAQIAQDWKTVLLWDLSLK